MDGSNSNTGSSNAYMPVALCFAAVLLVCTFFSPVPGFASVFVAAIVLTAAILYLRNYSTLVVGSVLALVVTGVSIGIAAYAAAQVGTTLQAGFEASMAQSQQIVLQIYGNAATPGVREAVAQAMELTVRFWPFMYFSSAVVMVALSFGACSFISKRFGLDLKITPLAQVDFSPAVLWVPVVGLLAFAASFLFEAQKDLMVTIALNLAGVTMVVLLVQVTGVYTGLVSRIKGWGFVKVFGYFLIMWLGALWIPSIIGLLDFWRNFRGLPREVDESGEPDETPSDGASL